MHHTVVPLLTAARAEQIIRAAAADSKRVILTTHAKEKMLERNITTSQLFYCLWTGKITEGPIWGLKGNWELMIEQFTAGDRIGIALAIERNFSVIVITAFHK